MKIFYISKDIKVFCVGAKSFPDGIQEAQKTIRDKISSEGERNLFGISNPVKNRGIIYKAAIEEAYEGEAEKYKCESFSIKKGSYFSESVTDWRNDQMFIQRTFQKLLSHPELDNKGYCLEIYPDDNGMGGWKQHTPDLFLFSQKV